MSYEQGFIEKCAQYGIDPQELVKEAARGDMFMKAIKRLSDVAPDAKILSQQGGGFLGAGGRRGMVTPMELKKHLYDQLSVLGGGQKDYGWTEDAAALLADKPMAKAMFNPDIEVPGVPNLPVTSPEMLKFRRGNLARRLQEIRTRLTQYDNLGYFPGVDAPMPTQRISYQAGQQRRTMNIPTSPVGRLGQRLQENLNPKREVIRGLSGRRYTT